jgi:iron complex outermembrane recepter protein
MNTQRMGRNALALAIGFVLCQVPTAAFAQGDSLLEAEPQDAAAQSEKKAAVQLDKIEVVGSQIKGVAASETLLPVVDISAEQIDALGATSGDELYRSIPQMGDVSFRNGFGTNSSNYARGDIASINLRGLGVGNTLLLLNGRRTVVHPTSQADEQLVPVLTFNANTIPVSNLQRVEVLLNGASAIYGTDAVAGVVNNVLRDDVDGGNINVQYGTGEGTGLRDRSISGVIGKNFSEMRGNVSLAYSLQDSTGLNSWDQDWTSTHLRWFDFVGTPFENAGGLDLREATTRWGNFGALYNGVIRSNGTALTTAAGYFHVQPTTNTGCGAVISDGVCVQSGAIATTGADRNLRYDANQTIPVSFQPKLDRINLFGTGKYDFDNGIGFFSELGYYRSRSDSLQQPVNSIASLPATIAASNYWNPFGAKYLPDGSLNPNRIADLNIPDEGVAITIRNYRFDEPTRIHVDNVQTRALAGLRGFHFGFDWESALLYSRASVEDTQNSVSATLFEKALALSTPNAYNPFGAGNSQAVIDSVMYQSVRKSTNSLALWDFKASRPDLLTLPAGDVGMAFGVEFRHEKQHDNRDGRVDGSIVWESLSGVMYPTDQYGVSPTPDTEGSRTVRGAYVEFYVPLISRDWNIPLVRNLDMQIAGRAEHYSDFGSVSKPKVAIGWEILDGLSMRGSWSQGFRAPNLEQVNATVVTRANSRRDYIQCEADLRKGAIANFADCSHSYSTQARRSGNPDLKPETSDNISGGIVFEPKFLPEAMGNVRFSLDYYKYKQEGIIGLFGEGNALTLDYVLRMQGKTNPNVVRAEPNADDIARYEGTGLAPAGQVLYATDQYVNLLPQTVRGVDFGVNWRSTETRIGRFDVSINGTRLIEFYREVSPAIQELMDARDAGLINAATVISGGGDLIMVNGKPRWKWTGNLIWTKGDLQLGTTARYTGNFYDTGLQYPDGSYWEPGSSTYWNAFAKYNFKGDGWLSGMSVKLGVNNVEDRRPPISVDSRGYLTTLYSAVPRYWFLNIGKEF